MGFNSFYSRTLKKGIKYFVLISTVIFSCISYGAGLGQDIGQGHLTDQDHQTSVEENAFFTESVEKYFTNGEDFDGGKPASRAFQAECSGEHESFSDNVNEYYRADYNRIQTLSEGENEPFDMDSMSESIDAIQESMEECKGSIYKEYTTLERKINEEIDKIGLISSGEVLEVLKTKVPNELPQKVKDLRKFFKYWGEFREKCLDLVREHEGRRITVSELNETTLGQKLKELHQNGCNQKKKEIKKLKPIFDKFVETPELCAQKLRCVMELRKDVGLESLAQGKLSLVGFISENTSVTNDCCLVTYECLHVPDAKRKYEAILKSVGSSKNESICQSGSPERTGALQQFGREVLETCRKSGSICLAEVNKALVDFRKRFLDCFFLPDFSERAYKLHARNDCNKQINEIREKFKEKAEKAQLFTIIGASNVTLESLSFSNNLNNHPFIEKCKEPFNRLNTDRELKKTRASGFLFHTCNESDQNENDQNQLAQGNQSGPFSIPMPHIRNNSNSGSPRSSSRNPQNQPQGPPVNFGASPTSEFPYEPDIYTDPNSSKTDGGESDSTPPPPGDPAFSGGQLTSSEGGFGEGKDKGKGKGVSDSANSTSSPSPDTSSLSPGSSISGFSPSSSSSSGQGEGAGDLSKSEGNSSNSGSNDGKEGDNDSEQSGKLAQNEAGLRGLSSSGGFAGSSYGGGSSGTRRFMRRVGSRVKKPLADAWKAAFGDPSKTVKNVFNVHGPEVNLLERQKELARQFCRLHKTCEGNFETEPLQ